MTPDEAQAAYDDLHRQPPPSIRLDPEERALWRRADQGDAEVLALLEADARALEARDRAEAAADLSRLEAQFGPLGAGANAAQVLEATAARVDTAWRERLRAWVSALAEVGAGRAVVLPASQWGDRHGDATRDVATAVEWRDAGLWPELIELGLARELGLVPSEREEQVEERAERLRIDREARRKVAAEDGGFGIFTAADVVSATDFHEAPEPVPLVAGVLGRAEVCMLFGDSYSGKSFAALGIANAIATGTSWAGRAAQRGRVLYLLLEGAGTWRARDAAWYENAGLPRGEGVDVFARGLSLLDTTTTAAMVAHLRDAGANGHGYDLIIVDTLSRAAAGADENSAELMSGLVRTFDQLREAAGAEASVLVLHHAKKDDPEAFRGSSVLWAAMDRVLCLRMVDPSRPDRKLITQKSKASQLPDDLPLKFVQVHAADSAVLVEGQAEGVEGLLAALANAELSGRSITRGELKSEAVEVGLYANEKSANATIQRLITAGRIVEYRGYLSLVKEV